MLRRLCRIAVLGAALAAASVSHAQLIIPGGSSSGSGATPGGSSGQLQFNNAGAFGGGAGTAWDDTNRALTISGATVTSSKPLLDLSQTWNAGAVAFSALKLSVTDTASASGSLLLDLQVGGVSRFKVDKGGAVTVGNTLYATDLLANTNGGVIAIGSAGDVKMYRDAANTLALRNGASAQSFNVYNTYTDASNYEKFEITWSGNLLYLGTVKAGTGSARAIQFETGSVGRWSIDATGNFITPTDNNYDIGASGANRPRNLYVAGKIVTGSTTLHETSVALTNGAAAATGTLTNAPVAGNPTKWFPINDNGTTRYVPAW